MLGIHFQGLEHWVGEGSSPVFIQLSTRQALRTVGETLGGEAGETRGE